MNLKDIESKVSIFLDKHPANYVSEVAAIHTDIIGMRIFEKAVFSVGNASDPLFDELKKEDILGASYKLPHEWNEDANSVLSYFLAYTDRIKKANAADMSKAVDEWYHARIEGQEMLAILGDYLCDLLAEEGHISIVPVFDEGFTMISRFNSNWSERHTGYICGLGTFSLSKAMITKLGSAGRLGSLITSAKLDITKREYSDLYEYCSKCGVCARNCPANCINTNTDMHFAKDHEICDDFCESTNKIFIVDGKEKLRYGCGKCEVRVPCENRMR